MVYMLDTNACIHLLTERNPDFQRRILEKLEALPADVAVLLSSVVVFELSYGVHKSRWRKANRAVLREFLLDFQISPFDESAAMMAGEVRADLERLGKPIGPVDTLIAAHALSLGATLVSHNAEEFARVRGLKLENWAGA